MTFTGSSTGMQNQKQKKLDKSLCDNDHLWLGLQQLPQLEPELTAAVVFMLRFLTHCQRTWMGYCVLNVHSACEPNVHC